MSSTKLEGPPQTSSSQTFLEVIKIEIGTIPMRHAQLLVSSLKTKQSEKGPHDTIIKAFDKRFSKTDIQQKYAVLVVFFVEEPQLEEQENELYCVTAIPTIEWHKKNKANPIYEWNEIIEFARTKPQSAQIYDQQKSICSMELLRRKIELIYNKRHRKEDISNFKLLDTEEEFDESQVIEVREEEPVSVKKEIKQNDPEKFESAIDKTMRSVRTGLKSIIGPSSSENSSDDEEYETIEEPEESEIERDGENTEDTEYDSVNTIKNDVTGRSSILKDIRIQRFTANDDMDYLQSWFNANSFQLSLQSSKKVDDQKIVGHLLSAIDNRGIKESLISILKDYSDRGIPITLKRFKSAIDKISRKSSETLIRDIDSIIFNSNKDTPRGLYKEIEMKTAQLIPDKTGARSYVDMMFKKKIAPNNVVFNQLNSDVTGEKLIKAAEDFLSLTKIHQVNNTMKGHNNKRGQQQTGPRFSQEYGPNSYGRPQASQSYHGNQYGRQNSQKGKSYQSGESCQGKYDERRDNSEGRGNNQRKEGYNNERSNNNSWNQEDKVAKIQKQGGCFRCGGPHLKRNCPQNNF